MKQYLKKYSDSNPEKFNKEFIMSRKDQDILKYVTDIFKSLEILDEIKVEEVTMETDESTFGPIKAQHHYYKSILPSRLNKIHYKIRITPNENVETKPIELGKHEQLEKENERESFIKEGDIYINKLIDDCFYINEGIRYFLVYQIVDNATYGVNDSISLKSLLMPITVKRNTITAVPEFLEDPIELYSYNVLLFSKLINPVLYILGKESYNSLVNYQIKDENNIFSEWQNYRDPELITKLNKFFGTSIVFKDKIEDTISENNYVFKIKSEKDKNNNGCYIVVNKKKFETNELTRAFVGCLLDLKNETKKKNIIFSYDNLISPWFWVDTLSNFFTSNNDYLKKFNKIKTMLISLNRLMDDSSREILNLKDEDKENSLTVIRYIIKNFDKLLKMDAQDLDNKRLRLYEYQLYPLRLYLSNQIYRVLNSPTHSKAVLDRIFSNLSPLYVIKQTVTNELLRYYNSTNEIDLYSSLLRYSMRGPQSLNKTVSSEQRDLHPSYTGRLSLIASPASDPGLSGNLSPFVEVYNYYFKKQ